MVLESGRKEEEMEVNVGEEVVRDGWSGGKWREQNPK